MIGDRLEAKFPGRLDLQYVFNIMDVGYKAEDILWLVDRGILTLGYQSSSYLTDDVPELGFVGVPEPPGGVLDAVLHRRTVPLRRIAPVVLGDEALFGVGFGGFGIPGHRSRKLAPPRPVPPR